RISGSWVTALGTPRSINAGAVSENTSSTNLTPTVSDASKKETVPLKPKISVLSEKSTIVNVPTSFDATYVGSGGNVISSGYFVWSMGDGTVYNFNQQKKFTHTYQYPGDYTVNVAYFYNSWSDEPVIETSFILDVTNPKISLATIGTKGDLSISNNSDQDIKISKWKIIKGSKEYIFPYGMVILANKNIIISTKVTGFDESGNALLYYPDNSVYGGVDTTQTEVINNKTVVSRNISNNKIQNNTVQNINLNNNKLETENISNQLVASTAVLEPQTKTNTRWWVFVLVVFIVCGFGYLAMKLYRSKESALQEDFHLLDE
ncbi:MAG: PKD domain-containing protein, partial [Minisyncoccia bacterium]